MAPKREIIYPIFLECCQFCTDMFWESIFEELAYGKPPSGVYISKDFLTCSYKMKEFCYKIERQDAEVLYNNVYALFTQKLGILSQRDKQKKKIDFYETEKSLKKARQDWGKIRRKNIKDIMYEK